MLAKINLILAILLICISIDIQAQNKEFDIIRDVIEKYIDNIESEVDYNDLYDQIEYLYKNPIYINRSNYNELLKIPLLTPQKAQAILNHINTYGPLKNIYELQVIESLDFELILILQYFIRTDYTPPIFDKKNFWKNSTHEIVIQNNRRLENSVGYSLPDSNKNKFLGDPNKLSVRYRCQINPYLNIGIQGEKDDGETFSNGFLSGFVNLKKYGAIQQLIIGDFQAAFGQGLTFGSGLAFGKSPYVLNTMRLQNGIRVSRSFNENEFLRGIGTTIKIHPNLMITGFYSNKKIDASTKNDSIAGDGFSSLVNTGNYRNLTELNKKGLLGRQIMGSNISMQLKNLKFGFTSVYTSYDKTPLIDSKKSYRAFYSNEKEHFNLGLDYQYLFKNILLYGEFSSNKQINSLSYINGILISLDKNLEINILHRNYQKDYQTTFTNAIGESVDNRNEKAIYTGLSLKPYRNYSINAYADFYQFDWLKYLIDAPSKGRDMMIELQYQKRKKYLWYIRYRKEEKEKNIGSTDNIRGLTLHNREIIRFHLENIVSKNITLKNRFEQTFYNIAMNKKSTGLLIFQDLIIKTNKNHSIIARYMYFESEDYNSRVYAFENDLLYTFSVPAFQNKGTRFYIMSKIKLNKSCTLWLRYSKTFYDNIESIGSSYDQINNHQLTNISFQLSCHI
ncbi:MAG: hypothetical protein Q8K70_07645 [Bacteroidota bacterium]|nr:hypothetical protein [Bacteroidota bacterium]